MDDFSRPNMIESSFLIDFGSPEIGSISPVGSESDWFTVRPEPAFPHIPYSKFQIPNSKPKDTDTPKNPTDQVYQLDTNMWLDVNSYISSTPASPSLYHASPESVDIGADELYFLSLPEDAKPLTQPRKKDPSAAVLQRRRAQNRASQRAYRDRKDKRVKDLEEQIDAMSAKNTALQAQLDAVLAEVEALRKEKAELAEWKSEREMNEVEKSLLEKEKAEGKGGQGEAPLGEEERSFTVKVVIRKNPGGKGTGVNAVAVVEGQ
jgi:hypothetical protein